MKDAFSTILQEIQMNKKEPLLIAIDGRCASGKTTLASRIKEEINCKLIEGVGHRLEIKNNIERNIDILKEVIKLY